MKTETSHVGDTINCLNCGAAVSYHYCSVCGQETKLHVPSAGEFIHEFVGHYVAIEGRLWKTLYYLLCKPGFLTAEYIAGRRVRYVEPLRIFLTFSIVFFAILKFMGPAIAEFDTETPAPPARVAPAPAGQAKAPPKLARQASQIDISSSKVVIGFSPTLEKKVNDFIDKPADDKKRIVTAAFYGYVPYALFLLMPVFALYLKMLYAGSGRRYGEHLLFALHTNAFAYLMFGLMIMVSTLGVRLLEVLLFLWLVFYLPTAMRRVYGGSRTMTALRWIVLVTVHVLSAILAILAAFALAVFN